MKVTLLHHTPLSVCIHAVRTCWQSFGKSDDGGPKDLELIEKVGNKFKHSSTLEHLNYNFYIQGISRALLQELARHRIASLSVKSTRYTLKELKDEDAFVDYLVDLQRATKYVVQTGEPLVDKASFQSLATLQSLVRLGIPNDFSKFALPDAYKTELTWTINARSLQNFLKLRTDKAAMWEIRRLAYEVYEQLPNDHKYLFTECVYIEKG